MSFDPEFEELARAFRRELQEEQAELELIAVEADLGSLDLPFVFLEAQWRGDRLRVVCLGRTFIGYVTHVGETIVTLLIDSGATANIAIHAILGIMVEQPAARPGLPRVDKDPVQFAARLREYAGIPNAVFEFGGGDPSVAITGRIVEVRVDHAVIRSRDNATWMLPIAAMSYCLQVPMGR
ncbi:MAG: hypothetical protein ACOYN3_01205 [Acidimicrobiia bacterium]